MREEGKLIVFSAPSGAGKTSIVQGVLKNIPALAFSVSACSRPKREGETHGKDYYFMTSEEFRHKITEGAFLEWEEVYPGSFYGTLKSEVERLWAGGKHVVFDVDVAGGLHIKRAYPERSLAIFVQPPSIAVLRERLLRRGTETEATLSKRIGKAEQELSYANQFDAIVVNEDLDEAIRESTSKVNAFLGNQGTDMLRQTPTRP